MSQLAAFTIGGELDFKVHRGLLRHRAKFIKKICESLIQGKIIKIESLKIYFIALGVALDDY